MQVESERPLLLNHPAVLISYASDGGQVDKKHVKMFPSMYQDIYLAVSCKLLY